MNAKRFMPVGLALGSFYSAKGIYSNCLRNVQRIQNKGTLRNTGLASAGEKSPKFVDVTPPLVTPVIPPPTTLSITGSDKEFDETSATSLLLKCGKGSPIKSIESRRENLQNVWNNILANKKQQQLSTNIYNTYIQVCLDNEMPIDYKTFLKLAQTGKPDQNTYLLLLKLASRLGDVNEAVEILREMKAHGMPADENVFNNLIVGYTLHKGLEGANYVLGTMKLAQVAISNKTNWAILEGLVGYGKRGEFQQFLEIIPKIDQNDEQFLELLHVLGAKGHHDWHEDITVEFDWDAKDRGFINRVQAMCDDLVHRNQSEAAVNYYNTFVNPQPGVPYGKHLLREMLTCNVSIEKVQEAAKKFLSKNSFVLFDLAELTLQKQLVEESYKTFESLSYLRPHFFWPLILFEAKQKGDMGVIGVLKKMHEFNVKPDYMTMEDFVLRCFNLTEPKNVLDSITQVPNIVHRDVLSPLVAVLLREKRIEEAQSLCSSSNKIPLLGDQLIRHLSRAWENTKNTSVVPILQKLCETNTATIDWTGIFLERCMQSCKTSSDCSKITALIRALDANKLKITSTFYDQMLHHIQKSKELEKYQSDIEGHLEKLLDISRQDASGRIAHPKDMKVEELEDHLVELEAKQMETRGVVRKLILSHARLGNHSRVQELREYMKDHNYEESAGMRSSLFHSFVLSGDIKCAKKIYEELKITFPSFNIDTFKIIDFATLLVRNGAVNEAVSVLQKETRPTKSDSSMDRNCWNLLGAAKKPEDAFKLFQLLVEKNYCKPTNVILGPILRPFVHPDTVDKLVSNFCNCVEEYNATPLQLEVLCVVLEAKNEKLMQKVINGITKVHGPAAARMGLIAALAEKGLEKPILKLLSERTQLRLSDLTQRIQRWVNEEKIIPLQTLEAANRRLSVNAFDNVLTSSAIMKIHCNRADFKAALTFWRHLEDNDGQLTKECAKELVYLLEKHNFKVPDSLRCVSAPL